MNSKFLPEPDAKPPVPKVRNVRPFGSTILVEMLSSAEALGTKLYMNKEAQVGAPQAYVVAIGPKLKPEDVGLKVGDRVMLQGTFVPVPAFDHSHRNRGIVEVHNVKAILDEETPDDSAMPFDEE